MTPMYSEGDRIVVHDSGHFSDRNRFGLSGLLSLTRAHVRILQKPSINQLLLITPLTSYLKGGDLSLHYQAIDSKLVDFQIPRHLFSSQQNFLHI